MKKRYLYALIFAVPGLLLALLVCALLFAVIAGVLWLYVFGDSPWPDATHTTFPMAFGMVFITLWCLAIFAGYRFGRGLEAQPGFEVRHLWYALGATLLPIAIVLLQQLSVGNIGPKSDSLLCSDYCRQRGYMASSLPPRDSGERTCSCLGHFGEAELTMPLDGISNEGQRQ
jgi:hypothetical protein